MQPNNIELPPTCKMNYVIKELCLNITTNLSGFNQTTACVTSHAGVADDDGIATDVHNVFMVFSSTPKCSATQVNSFQLQPMPTMRCDKYCNIYSVFILKWSRIIYLKLFSWEFWKTVCSSMYVWGYSKNKKTKTKKTPQNVPFFIFIPNCKTVDGV